MEENLKDKEEDDLLAPVTPVKLGCQSAQGSSISSSEAKTGVAIQESMINSLDTNRAKLGCTGAEASSVSSLKAKTGAIQESTMDSSDTHTSRLLGNSQIELCSPCHDDDLSCGVGARSGFAADNCGVGVGKVSELGKSSCMTAQEPNAGTDASRARNSQSDFGREDFNFTPDSKQSQKQQQRGIKRKSTGIDFNKKPRQRVKAKVHRPKIFDASKPKKTPKEKIPEIPKEKKVRKKAEKSKKTPGLNAATATKPEPKKIPKEKKVREKVTKSEKTSEGLDPKTPKTPGPCTPEPLVAPALTPTALEISFEGSNSETIGKFSDHGTSFCRRTLKFNLEDTRQDGGDGNVNELVTGGVDNLIGAARIDGDWNVNEVVTRGGIDNLIGVERIDRDESDRNVNEVVAGCIDNLTDPKVDSSLGERCMREILYTYHRRSRGHVFDMLVPMLAFVQEEEDFGCSEGIKLILGEYRRFDALFKNFPQFLKRRRSKRQKRGLDSNLKMTINGDKVPTKKRSNTQRYGRTCRDLLLLSSQVIRKRKRSKRSKRKTLIHSVYQNPRVHPTWVQNLTAQPLEVAPNVLPPPFAAADILTLAAAAADSHNNVTGHIQGPDIVTFAAADSNLNVTGHIQALPGKWHMNYYFDNFDNFS